MADNNGVASVVSPRVETRSINTAVNDMSQVTRRPSLMENMRASPRVHRDSTASQHSHLVQDLINHPPVAHNDPVVAKFAHREWRDIQLGEITVPEDVHFVNADASVEEATKVSAQFLILVHNFNPILTRPGQTLLTSSTNVVLLRENNSSKTAVGAFDYDTLNAYLCLVTGLALPDEVEQDQVRSVIDRAARHEPISLTDVSYLMGRKETPAFLDHTVCLPSAVEIFGSGIHRIIVTKSGTDELIGVLTQLRLVRFFWEHVRSADSLNARSLRDLSLGESSVISIK